MNRWLLCALGAVVSLAVLVEPIALAKKPPIPSVANTQWLVGTLRKFKTSGLLEKKAPETGGGMFTFFENGSFQFDDVGMGATWVGVWEQKKGSLKIFFASQPQLEPALEDAYAEALASSVDVTIKTWKATAKIKSDSQGALSMTFSESFGYVLTGGGKKSKFSYKGKGTGEFQGALEQN